MDVDVDALVVGGAAAGLSAGLVLGRARVRTLVVDAGEPSNLRATAIGGLLGQDGTSSPELYAAGRAQLMAHPTVVLRSGRVTGIEPVHRDGDGEEPAFRAKLADGDQVVARRVLLAGGMRYQVPDTPGLAELWGGAAFACPYCHGWENRDRRIGILGATGAAHRVALLRSWSEDLIVLADGVAPAPEDREALRAAGVPIIEQPVAAVAPGVVRLADGDEFEIDALHVLAPMAPRDDLAARLGVATTELPNGTGVVEADPFGVTSVSGVFAAGDTAGAGNVAASIAGGSLAATGLHRSLVIAPTR